MTGRRVDVDYKSNPFRQQAAVVCGVCADTNGLRLIADIFLCRTCLKRPGRVRDKTQVAATA